MSEYYWPQYSSTMLNQDGYQQLSQFLWNYLIVPADSSESPYFDTPDYLGNEYTYGRYFWLPKPYTIDFPYSLYDYNNDGYYQTPYFWYTNPPQYTLDSYSSSNYFVSTSSLRPIYPSLNFVDLVDHVPEFVRKYNDVVVYLDLYNSLIVEGTFERRFDERLQPYTILTEETVVAGRFGPMKYSAGTVVQYVTEDKYEDLMLMDCDGIELFRQDKFHEYEAISGSIVGSGSDLCGLVVLMDQSFVDSVPYEIFEAN